MNLTTCTTDACECKQRRIDLEKEFISQVGAEAYEEFLIILPDCYYDLGEFGKLRAWRHVLHSVRNGERNLQKLAQRMIQ